jgi:methionyl-tRNA formyltransferase
MQSRSAAPGNPSSNGTATLPDVVFFGSGAFGLPVLRMLAEAGRVALVVSQPDRVAGRGKQLTPTPVSEFALGHGLPLVRPEDCKSQTDSELIRTAAAAAVDRAARDGRAQPGVVFVVIAFGQKMSPELLSDVFSINLHGSLLPRWRGAAPIQRALMEGDPVAGVSVIALAERMDAGVVYAEEPLAIGPSQTSGELHDALSELGPDVIASVLHMWRRGDINARAQDETRATRARKLSKSDAWVDLSMDAFHVRARINGLNPWPGCAVEIDGAPMQIRRCEVVTAVPEPTDSAMGTGTTPSAGTLTPEGILTCGTGAVRILEVQAAGGRILSFAAWAHGARIIAPVQVTSAAPTAEP